MSGTEKKSIGIYYYRKDDFQKHNKEVEVRIVTHEHTHTVEYEVEKYQWGPVKRQYDVTVYSYSLEFSKEIRDLQKKGYKVSVPTKKIEAIIKEKFPNQWCTGFNDKDTSSGSYFENNGRSIDVSNIKLDYTEDKYGKAKWTGKKNKPETCDFSDVRLVFGKENSGDTSITTSYKTGLLRSLKKATYPITVAE